MLIYYKITECTLKGCHSNSNFHEIILDTRFLSDGMLCYLLEGIFNSLTLSLSPSSLENRKEIVPDITLGLKATEINFDSFKQKIYLSIGLKDSSLGWRKCGRVGLLRAQEYGATLRPWEAGTVRQPLWGNQKDEWGSDRFQFCISMFEVWILGSLWSACFEKTSAHTLIFL